MAGVLKMRSEMQEVDFDERFNEEHRILTDVRSKKQKADIFKYTGKETKHRNTF